MKICLVNAPMYCLKRDLVPLVPPLGLASLAAALERAGHDVFVLDALLGGSGHEPPRHESGTELLRFGYPERTIGKMLADFNPDVIGISNNMAVNEREALDCARVAKEFLPRVPVVFGGVNATARSESILSNAHVDYVIAGEGDIVLPELIDRLEHGGGVDDMPWLGYKDGSTITPPRLVAVVQDVDGLPEPAWRLLDMDKYIAAAFPFPHISDRNAVMMTSRGCVNNCVFCSGRKLLGRWRPRSLEMVRHELRRLKKDYGVKSVHFMDANINADPARFARLCEMLGEEGLSWSPIGGLFIKQLNADLTKLMLENGCFYLTLAVEHGCSDIQRYIGKRCELSKVREIVKIAQEKGVWTHASFIVGFPDEIREQSMQCLEFAVASLVDSISVFTATPLPGSKLYCEVSEYMELGPQDMRFLGEKSYSRMMGIDEINAIKEEIFTQFARRKILYSISHPVAFCRRLLVGRKAFINLLFQSLRRYVLLRFKR